MAVSTDCVREILPADTGLTDQQIQAAINASTCAMSQIDACLNYKNFTSECKDIISQYLAAHFAACTENTLSLSGETDACCGGSARYGFQFGEGIMGTSFGQNANTISNGCVAALDAQPAGIFSIGGA